MAIPEDDPSTQFINWTNATDVRPESYICGFCGDKVASGKGYEGSDSRSGTRQFGFIRICPSCKAPTFFSAFKRYPREKPGKDVGSLPEDLSLLYQEARLAAGAGAYTSAVLACRKMLMHIAVAEKAAPGLSFLEYVVYLDNNGFVPPRGKGWVDYIRTKGNEANHEIVLMGESDTTALISFIEMLLRFIYEFPNMIPGQTNP
jgi:hypothetical protein